MCRILIVDDEPNMLKSYGRIFRRKDYEVQYASSGKEALKMAEEFRPDVALLDIMMPGIDGYEVCEAWKRKPATQEIEVLFVSGKGELDDRLRAYRLRASDFLVKPFSKDELLAKIELITEKRRFYLELATTDALTGVGNRKFFEEKFANIFRIASQYNQIFSIAIIDVDHFKAVNDTYGHDMGDFVLQQVAELMKGKIRKSDLLARIGGEEFAVLLSGTEGQNTRRIMERLRKGVAEHVFQKPGESQSLQVTISSGYSCFPATATDKEGLFKTADKALYQAKQQGRNKIVP